MKSSATVLLVLFVVATTMLSLATLVKGDGKHSPEPTNPQCGPTAKYQHPTPRTPDAFERVVVQGSEVFAVRFHNESVLECRQMASTWEKFALTYHKKIRLVTYYMDGGAVSETMASYLGIKEEGYPNLKLYVKRSSMNDGTNSGGEESGRSSGSRPDICSKEPSLSTTVHQLHQEAEAQEWDDTHPDYHPPLPEEGMEHVDDEEHHIIKVAKPEAARRQEEGLLIEDEGEDMLDIKILPPHKKKELDEKLQARSEELDALSKKVLQCKPKGGKRMSPVPEPILVGRGSSFSLMRGSLDALLEDLQANKEGYHLKKK